MQFIFFHIRHMCVGKSVTEELFIYQWERVKKMKNRSTMNQGNQRVCMKIEINVKKALYVCKQVEKGVSVCNRLVILIYRL